MSLFISREEAFGTSKNERSILGDERITLKNKWSTIEKAWHIIGQARSVGYSFNDICTLFDDNKDMVDAYSILLDEFQRQLLFNDGRIDIRYEMTGLQSWVGQSWLHTIYLADTDGDDNDCQSFEGRSDQ